MTNYDPNVLQKEVDRIYSKANGMIYSYGVFGFLVGAVILAVLSQGDFNRASQLDIFSVGLVAVCTLIGAYLGKEAGHRLRVRAQLMLVNMQIEKNTRTLKGNHNS
jgi:hypothetical protein